MDRRNLFEKIFGYCPMCDKWFCKGVKRRRQNTAYQDEESNYVTVCPICFEEIQENWAEMWKDYWSSRI